MLSRFAIADVIADYLLSTRCFADTAKVADLLLKGRAALRENKYYPRSDGVLTHYIRVC